MSWIKRMWYRWGHVHLYQVDDQGPRDPDTQLPTVFTESGPAVDRLVCRCGHEIFERTWVHL